MFFINAQFGYDIFAQRRVCSFAAMHSEILLFAFCDDFEEQINMRLSGLAVILPSTAAVVRRSEIEDTICPCAESLPLLAIAMQAAIVKVGMSEASFRSTVSKPSSRDVSINEPNCRIWDGAVPCALTLIRSLTNVGCCMAST